MNKQNRNEMIDLLRGFAAICVILGHAIIFYPIDLTAIPWCNFLRETIYTFHMPLFFVLSGCVYRCKSYKSFILKKVQRLLIPYAIFESISTLLHVFGGSLINGTVSISEGIYDALFCGGGYWFIYTIFVLFAIYPLFDRICRFTYLKVAVMVLLIVVNQLVKFPTFLCIDSVITYFPYVIFGQLIMTTDLSHVFEQIRKKPLIFAAGFAVVFVLINILMHFIALPAVEYYLTFIRMVSICGALYGLFYKITQATNRFATAVTKLLSETSRYSLQMYLFDGYLLTVLRTIICSVLNIDIPIVIILCLWIVNIAITLFVCKVIVSKVRFLRVLCGV